MRNLPVVVLVALAAAACHPAAKSSSHDGGELPEEPSDMGAPPDGYFAPSAIAVSGQVVDFETGKPVDGAATVAITALMPPPTMSMTGANFALQVPPDSTFFLIAAGPPDHRMTYDPPTVVKTMPVEDVQAETLSETYLTKLASAFAVAPAPGSATVLVRAVDGTGAPAASIDGSVLTLGAAVGAKGPFFLDANKQPQPGAKATSASGYLVYFDMPPGMLQLGAGAGFTVQADATPTAANAVSLVDAVVTKGTASAPPTNVSFTQQVMPIFVARGCYNCHSGNGDGRRLGDLMLDGAAQKVWAALTQTVSPNFGVTRVNLQAPEKSLVLTMPSYEVPPDPHPTVVFVSTSDVDYQKILAWIKEGAKLN